MFTPGTLKSANGSLLFNTLFDQLKGNRTMRNLMLFATTVMLLPLAGCNRVEFQEFSSPEGKFSILMPGTPEKKTQTTMGMTVVMFGKDVRNGAYAVGYADIPRNVPTSLSGAVQGIARSHSGKILSEKDYMFEGTKGKEFEVEIPKPKGFISGRVILIKNRLYQMFAMGTNARLSDPDVQKFIKSFKLIK